MSIWVGCLLCRINCITTATNVTGHNHTQLAVCSTNRIAIYWTWNHSKLNFSYGRNHFSGITPIQHWTSIKSWNLIIDIICLRAEHLTHEHKSLASVTGPMHVSHTSKHQPVQHNFPVIQCDYQMYNVQRWSFDLSHWIWCFTPPNHTEYKWMRAIYSGHSLVNSNTIMMINKPLVYDKTIEFFKPFHFVRVAALEEKKTLRPNWLVAICIIH